MARVKDMTGQQIGHLFVLERDLNVTPGHGAYWKCQCDCGKVITIRGDSLRSGKTTSCGFSPCCERAPKPVINIMGMKFGKLKVTERCFDEKYKPGKTKQSFWKCICDCGNITYVTSHELRSGNTQSCGCSRGKKAEDLTGKIFGRLTVIERDYIYGDTRWWCKCKCGNRTSVKASSLRSKSIQSCGKCGLRMSIGESIISDILLKYNIDFIYNYSFDDCVSPDYHNKLPFDFYLPKYKVCIEFDGLQHFKPIDFFGGEVTYKRQVFLDNVKNEYCNKHKIRLIRIPHSCTNDEIEQIIKDIQESRNDHSNISNYITYADNSHSLMS